MLPYWVVAAKTGDNLPFIDSHCAVRFPDQKAAILFDISRGTGQFQVDRKLFF